MEFISRYCRWLRQFETLIHAKLSAENLGEQLADLDSFKPSSEPITINVGKLLNLAFRGVSRSTVDCFRNCLAKDLQPLVVYEPTVWLAVVALGK